MSDEKMFGTVNMVTLKPPVNHAELKPDIWYRVQNPSRGWWKRLAIRFQRFLEPVPREDWSLIIKTSNGTPITANARDAEQPR